jgi:hypothetical protein
VENHCIFWTCSLDEEEIRKACHDEYPKIAHQINRSDRDLLSLICDQFIDLEVEEKNNKPIVSESHEMQKVENPVVP